jgi:GT2 family glycosyltransferase
MEWMMHGGQQNNFDALLGTTSADPRHFFYGAFISMKRSMIHKKQFPAMYKQYGWEDIDFGRQLADDGITLTVLHNALALHHHAYTADDIYKRQYHTGRGILMFKERYPDIECEVPKGCEVPIHAKRRLKLYIYHISGMRSVIHWILSNVAHKYCFPRLFLTATAMEFWYGAWKRQKQ